MVFTGRPPLPPSERRQRHARAGYAARHGARIDVLDLVGSTPIVRCDKLPAGVPGQLLAKLEYLNPGGSVKDRIGLA